MAVAPLPVETPVMAGAAARARYHLLFVVSAGGHLAQLLQLRPWWEGHHRTWVTFDTVDASSTLRGERWHAAHHPTTRNLRNLAKNAALARRILLEHRPDVVISTGAGIALPFFALARAYGIPTVYLEVYDRVDSRTLTGRLCRPLSTAFCVQWDEQVALYAGAERVGMVL